ncbi:MAG TPA: GxxExxY protein [Flavobacteriales bacterium]|nr:GxxExxY protein [Flavobacteriales bacterium]HNU55079.1 GxxExxY protein [Flavobacteriales bacterium]
MSGAWTYNELTEQVIGAAIEVHRELGPGLLEKVYEECLCRELEFRGVPFRRQVAVPVMYKGERLESIYRCDLWVAGLVIVEAKSVEALHPIHEAQLLGYLKLMDQRLGLLINFNVKLLKQGIKRIANRMEE